MTASYDKSVKNPGLIKPALLYTPEGGFRQFGVGYKQKTVIPIWIVAILLAIFSYLGVLYYLMNV
jgi:hypothetical protein